MRLQNFEISSSIELQSAGLFWDLHNFARFLGLEIIPAENIALMSWSVPKGPNPWGCNENKFAGMKLRFTGLQVIRLSPRDPDLPLTEDICVSEILKVDPRVDHADPHMRAVWEMTDRFHLAISFQSRRMIELGSEAVELIPVSGDSFVEPRAQR